MSVQVCSGFGTCNIATRSCSCRPGHTGLDCSSCQPGYYRASTGQCLLQLEACAAVEIDSSSGNSTTANADMCDTSIDARLACGLRGVCKLGMCACDQGFSGPLCQLSLCPAGWTETECACCPSGVISSSGACCQAVSGTAPALDRDGNCCASGQLDAKGICDGTCANVDAQGKCCDRTMLDGRFECCASGAVDWVRFCCSDSLQF